jgi:hypothetical protein
MQNDSAAAFVKDDGQQVINKVQAQKGRSVVKRATAKAAKEIIGKSIYDSIFGESQEK